MKGDGRYARGFTLLLCGLGILLIVAMSFEPIPPRAWRGSVLRLVMPPPGEFSEFWSTFAVLLLVVALIRSWGVAAAWHATWLLCVPLFLWFPLGTLASWSWFRSLRRLEKPLTG